MLGDVGKCTVASVAIEDGAVLVVDVDLETIDFREHVAVDQQQIFPAVVVEIEEAAAPADEAGVVREARRVMVTSSNSPLPRLR